MWGKALLFQLALNQITQSRIFPPHRLYPEVGPYVILHFSTLVCPLFSAPIEKIITRFSMASESESELRNFTRLYNSSIEIDRAQHLEEQLSKILTRLSRDIKELSAIPAIRTDFADLQTRLCEYKESQRNNFSQLEQTRNRLDQMQSENQYLRVNNNNNNDIHIDNDKNFNCNMNNDKCFEIYEPKIK